MPLRKVPGRCIGYPTHPPQTRTCGTTASGSSVPTVLTISETKQGSPRLAHNYATPNPLVRQVLTHSAEVTVIRFVVSEYLP